VSRAALAFLLVALASGRATADLGEGAHSLEQVMECFIKGIPPAAHGRFSLVHDHPEGQGADHTAAGEYWAEVPEVGARKVLIASRDAWDGKAGVYLFSEGDALGEAWGWREGEPAARKIAAGSPEGYVFHTDVSFEDFARFARIVSPGQVRRLPDATVDGRAVFVLEIKPGPDAHSSYDRVVSSIDKEWCTPLRREGYSAKFEGGARPLRVFSVAPADVKLEQGFARATKARLQDLADGSETRVELVDLELGGELAEDFFTPENLPRALR
jgi:hypothetical protein